MYGIVEVWFDAEAQRFVRKWVQEGGEPILHEDHDIADKAAGAMNEYVKRHLGWNRTGYRARRYDSEVYS